MSRRLFLVIYLLSGLAGLIYEVTWTRLLTLHFGHTVAAVSTVLAAYMGGLAIGAALGGRYAATQSRERALWMYGALELVIGACAILVLLALSAFTPLLAWAYRNGDGGALFGFVRVVTSFVVLAIPTMAMGATLPLAARWWVQSADRAGTETGWLYGANAVGATVGAIMAGFFLVPTLGLRLTTLVGVLCNVLAALGAFQVTRLSRGVRLQPDSEASLGKPEGLHYEDKQSHVKRDSLTGSRARRQENRSSPVGRLWLAAAALAVSGFVALVYEIVWTRILALLIGPTTYAFSTMLASFIGGIAIGSLLGSLLARRTRQPTFWLAMSLALSALGSVAASSAIGRAPVIIADLVASPSARFGSVLAVEAGLTFLLLLPTTLSLGAAFPLAIATAVRRLDQVAADIGVIYSANTLGAITGSLVGGFVLVPLLGLQNTLLAASAIAGAASLCVLIAGPVRSLSWRVTGCGVLLAAIALGLWLPPWDPRLAASGAYKYASYIKAPDRQSALEAGTLLYYREGASGTVSVKQLTGSLSLSIDGKVDASNAGDMLTQKLLAHLPLLLHPNPKRMAIIGLGSGVTLGAALRHQVRQADVLEISAEVIEASSYFNAENHDALADPRTRLIVGDGRSHLQLSSDTYDVIVSEPSNPWMAGVATLFTREFFEAARARLAPGGLLCQWAHTYDIRDEDLRSIAGTFSSVFPHATVWLVGDSDLLMIGSNAALAPRLDLVPTHWARAGVASDLAEVAVRSPFNLFALYLSDERGLQRYGANATVQTDDRMPLEFSAPRAMTGRYEVRNPQTLRALSKSTEWPAVIRNALQTSGAADWTHQGLMALQAEAYEPAYDAFTRAITLDRRQADALDGLLKAAAGRDRLADARAALEELVRSDPANAPARLALSRGLVAAGGERAAAMALEAVVLDPRSPAALEQLASVYADLQDPDRLKPVADQMQRDSPTRPETAYYAASVAFLEGRFPDAIGLAMQAIDRDPSPASSSRPASPVSRPFPSHARAHNLLGAAYATLGQTDRARESFRASLQSNPRDSTTYVNAGVFELTQGNSPAAIRYFSEALTLDPTLPPALSGLADALEREGHLARAARVRRATARP